MFKLYLRNAFL